MSAIVGPIPPYSNPPIEPQFYQPRMFFISNVTLGVQTTITTTQDMDYVLGQQVRLIIPYSFGCRELNNQTGFVVSIPSPNEVVIDIFSVGITPFMASSARTQPQILPIGDANNGIVSSTGNINQLTGIPGAFINISPN